jgi:hypothetical protein
MTPQRSASPPVSAADALELFRQGRARPGMCVEGVLQFPPEGHAWVLPPDLEAEVFDFSQCNMLENLPSGLRCYELDLSNTRVRSLPGDLDVESILKLAGCAELVELPEKLQVGTLDLRGCQSLAALPEGLDVWFLDLTGCWNFRAWPTSARIRSGRLRLRGCTALSSLPAYLGPLAALDVRDCPNLYELSKQLRIAGWIDLAQSGLAETKRLPSSLRGVDLRWQGVRIDARVIFQPETITVAEILGEQNAERRRVLLDRFGVSRFMTETEAVMLDQDTDPGGPRKLLFVDLKEDEPLVTLSCFCPSTGKNYFLRVPPDMKTCHQAAAWIAGFDDPAHYNPLKET